MKATWYEDVTDFWQAAGPLLATDPVHNTVLLSLVGRILRGVRQGDAAPMFLTVHDGPDLIGAVLCTPPYPLVVGNLPPKAVAVVVGELFARGVELTGASGIRRSVAAFGREWADRTGTELVVGMDERLYRLGTLDRPTDVPGDAHEATEGDVELLARWRDDFVVEAIGGRIAAPSQSDGIAQVRRSMAAGSGQILWRVDGVPVSQATVGAPYERTSRIGPVYTPVEFRGHGYGSAATAAAAQWALDRGAEHVVLFTDLANPVSNSIYQRIGFRPIADALEVTFRPGRLP
jgi:RimJ/RimL family protein N-acetyltransferase